MREDFLHYLWRLQRYDRSDLRTTDNHDLEIVHQGTHNHDGGPDFLNARIRIGETLWAGNVELHLRSSDWLRHGHQHDAAYQNVILHVVLDADQIIEGPSGQPIPTLELRQRVPTGILSIYQKLVHNEHWIPCQHHFHHVAEFTRNLWLDRLLVERLERKTEDIHSALEAEQQNWEKVFYHRLACNFGMKVNAEPFGRLARSLPLSVLAKHKNNLFQVQALLFGQAGMLERDFADDFPIALQKEYRFLRAKFHLQPIEAAAWKFMRMRPGNFPTIRIAQFARLIQQSSRLFGKVLDAEDRDAIHQLFRVELDSYWRERYIFDKPSDPRSKTLGKSAVDLIIINTIVPFLFHYARVRGDETYRDRAMQLLETLPPEQNRIIRGWARLGVDADSAYRTQALIELKNEYCTPKRCTSCTIGNSILSSEVRTEPTS